MSNTASSFVLILSLHTLHYTIPYSTMTSCLSLVIAYQVSKAGLLCPYLQSGKTYWRFWQSLRKSRMLFYTTLHVCKKKNERALFWCWYIFLGKGLTEEKWGCSSCLSVTILRSDKWIPAFQWVMRVFVYASLTVSSTFLCLFFE